MRPGRDSRGASHDPTQNHRYCIQRPGTADAYSKDSSGRTTADYSNYRRRIAGRSIAESEVVNTNGYVVPGSVKSVFILHQVSQDLQFFYIQSQVPPDKVCRSFFVVE